jgi:signal transduction histidine kinase
MKLVESILNSVKRAGRITRRLLTFARNLQAEIQSINLKEVLEEVINFLRNEAEVRDITIGLDIAEDIPTFESDRGKLQQIFLNIINNAFAALSDGGFLKIEADRKGDSMVSIKFTDNGCGISPEDLGHVFEPFFSTRKSEGGTGLGLSITYNLIHEIGGRIGVTSEPSKGTSFTITLPIRKGENKGECS